MILLARCASATTILLVALSAVGADGGGIRHDRVGVWEGSLGHEPIVACFNGPGEVANHDGSYFLKRLLSPIHLEEAKDGGRWHEEGGIPTWVLTAPVAAAGNTIMTGEWADASSGLQLAIRLRRIDDLQGVAPELAGRACARDSYNGPMEAALKLEFGERRPYGVGRDFRTIGFAAQQTVELFGPETTLAKINRELKADLDHSRAAQLDFFKYRRQGLGYSGQGWGDGTEVEPVFWTSEWVTVHNYYWPTVARDTSGPILSGYRTWDIKSGKRIDPWSWFGLKAIPATSVHDHGQGVLSATLRRFLLKSAGLDGRPHGPDCAKFYGPAERYHLLLQRDGVVFSPLHAGDGCDLFAPYRELRPLLTLTGAAAARRIARSRW